MQRQLAGLTREEFGDDGPVAGDGYFNRHIRSALHMDHFVTTLRLIPTLRRLVFALVIELFDIKIFHVWFNVGESPGDPLIVSDDDEGRPRQTDTGNVEVLLRHFELHLVPDSRNTVVEVHVVREQRLAADSVGAGDYPVV